MTANHGLRLLNTFYRYEVNLVWVWRGWEVLIISSSMSPGRNPLKILRLCPVPTASEWWYGMVLWHYDCQPWLKAFKHFLYVWSESGMSMKWMGGPNHILQHVPKEKPTENPTTVPTPSRVMVWCCTLMATHHTWNMLNTFYMYELDLILVWRGWEVLIISYSMSPGRNPLKILRLCPLLQSDGNGMVWCCGIMTASHGWRLLNTFYRYEVNLVWV